MHDLVEHAAVIDNIRCIDAEEYDAFAGHAAVLGPAVNGAGHLRASDHCPGQ